MAITVLLGALILLLQTAEFSAAARLNHASQLDVGSPDANFQTIIPDWVDSYAVPYLSVSVIFGGRSSQGAVISGTKLTEAAARQAPTVSITAAHPKKGDLYTLLMVDPDAVSPTKPIYRNFLHWIVTNVPSGASDALKEGTEVVSYSGPSPPMGVHRYYVLIFKQRNKISVDAISNRQQFSVRSFSDRYRLSFPVGGMYFMVEAGP